MLGTLDTAKKERWSQSLNQLVHVYNCTKSEVTGYSPYYLMFGREGRLPIDVHFGTRADGKMVANHQKYVERMKEDLRHAYKLSLQNAQKTQQRNKRLYDQRVKFRVLKKRRLCAGQESCNDWETKVTRSMELSTLPCPGEVAESACVQGEAKDRNRRCENFASGSLVANWRRCEDKLTC